MVVGIDDLGALTPDLATAGGYVIECGADAAPMAPVVVDGVVSRGALFGRLGTARVTTVSAPAGSGKTFLLRSWIGELGMAHRAACVAVKGGERNPQRFWIAVADALRATSAGSALVRPPTAAADLDGWATMERLLEDLAALREPVWLVIDDVHELAGDDALCQLELMIMRTPPQLRFVLLTRQDLRLNLHRLRLEGQLSEIRGADLCFGVAEARALFEAADVHLSEPALALLHARAEGWPAGLRLAALALAGHPDPERFATEFSGSERTVADYLLAEVLERQPDDVQRLLLRTSVLKRVNGELADLLTGDIGGQRSLQQLEAAGAFVTSLDAGRSWFRYHPLFADLLDAELRRIAPAEPRLLHAAVAEWFAAHGCPLEAVRHAEAAENWPIAARLLADHWVDLVVDGQVTALRELLAGFPLEVVADAEVTVLRACDELVHGSREEGERQLALAVQRSDSVPPDRHDRFQVLLALSRLAAAWRRGDLPAMSGESDRLLARVEGEDPAHLGIGADLRALAVIALGITGACAARLDQADENLQEADRRLERADRHLAHGVTLARRIGRPYLELLGLAHGAAVASRRGAVGELLGRQAIELAGRHGWEDRTATGHAYLVLGSELLGHGRLEEAEPWIQRAAQTRGAQTEPVLGTAVHATRGLLELAAGRCTKALAEFRAGDRLAGTHITSRALATDSRALIVQTLVRTGRTDRAEALLAGLDERGQGAPGMRIALAMLRLASRDQQAAVVALAPVVDGSIAGIHPIWTVTALLLEAIARDSLGDADAAGCVLERALDIAEPDRWLLPFLLHPAPRLLARHAGQTAHAGLVTDILGRTAGSAPSGGSAARPERAGSGAAVRPHDPAPRLREPLSEAETRVLRYLPSSLSVPEIAGELYLSVNTIRTHLRHIYDKLDAHRRHEAIERARALGLVPGARR